METHLFVAFVIATTIMIAMPGPSVLLTVAHGVSFGWRPALRTVAGATIGIAVQLAVAAVGLASLLSVASHVLRWLRWAGAAYLVYLGIRQCIRANDYPRPEASPVSGKKLLLQGVATTVPNPKSLVFIAAYLPQFMDSARPVGAQLAVIIPVFLAITFCVTSVWAILAGTARRLLKSRSAMRSVRRVAGGLTILTGAGLILVSKTP